MKDFIHQSWLFLMQGPDEFLEAKGKDELIALFKNPISAVEF